jgi:hypothetical protein
MKSGHADGALSTATQLCCSVEGIVKVDFWHCEHSLAWHQLFGFACGELQEYPSPLIIVQMTGCAYYSHGAHVPSPCGFRAEFTVGR